MVFSLKSSISIRWTGAVACGEEVPLSSSTSETAVLGLILRCIRVFLGFASADVFVAMFFSLDFIN